MKCTEVTKEGLCGNAYSDHCQSDCNGDRDCKIFEGMTKEQWDARVKKYGYPI